MWSSETNRRTAPRKLDQVNAGSILTSGGGSILASVEVLGLLGIDPREMTGLGRDLTRGKNHLVVFRDGSFIDDEHEFIRAPGPADASQCYDAQTGAPVPPDAVAAKQRAAEERLAISDLIIEGNLIPDGSPRKRDGHP